MLPHEGPAFVFYSNSDISVVYTDFSSAGWAYCIVQQFRCCPWTVCACVCACLLTLVAQITCNPAWLSRHLPEYMFRTFPGTIPPHIPHAHFSRHFPRQFTPRHIPYNPPAISFGQFVPDWHPLSLPAERHSSWAVCYFFHSKQQNNVSRWRDILLYFSDAVDY